MQLEGIRIFYSLYQNYFVNDIKENGEIELKETSEKLILLDRINVFDSIEEVSEYLSKNKTKFVSMDLFLRILIKILDEEDKIKGSIKEGE